MQRLLHEPTIRLKGLPDAGSPAHGRLQIVRELFGLDGAPSAADDAEPGAADNVRELGSSRRRAAQ